MEDPVVLRKGAVLVVGGKALTVVVPVARVREAPTTQSEIVARKFIGMKFEAHQKINGQKVAGMPLWWGDQEGQRWMHGSLFGPAGLKVTGEEEQPGDDPSVGDPPVADDIEQAPSPEEGDLFDEDVGEEGDLVDEAGEL